MDFADKPFLLRKLFQDAFFKKKLSQVLWHAVFFYYVILFQNIILHIRADECFEGSLYPVVFDSFFVFFAARIFFMF